MKKITFVAIFLLSVCTMFAQKSVRQQNRSEERPLVEIVTSEGTIVVELFNDTPVHRDNFIKLVETRFYDSLLFHRVIRNFMIQAGDPNSRNAPYGKMLGDGTLDYLLPAEISPKHFHRRGALCAARMGDNVNPEKKSSPCQFYIVQGRRWQRQEIDMMRERMSRQMTEDQIDVYMREGGAPHLDGDYTVFGQVVSGMDVVDRIASVKTNRADRPVDDVTIITAHVLNTKKAERTR